MASPPPVIQKPVGDLDSLINVIGLSPKDPLDTFIEIWFHVFLWSFFSSLLIHVGAAGMAFASLRKHKVARFYPIFILISGILTPLCVSLITSELTYFEIKYVSQVTISLPFRCFNCGRIPSSIVSNGTTLRITVRNRTNCVDFGLCLHSDSRHSVNTGVNVKRKTNFTSFDLFTCECIIVKCKNKVVNKLLPVFV